MNNSNEHRIKPMHPKHLTGKPGRNQPCPCGSGIKFKRCHLAALHRRQIEEQEYNNE